MLLMSTLAWLGCCVYVQPKACTVWGHFTDSWRCFTESSSRQEVCWFYAKEVWNSDVGVGSPMPSGNSTILQDCVISVYVDLILNLDFTWLLPWIPFGLRLMCCLVLWFHVCHWTLLTCILVSFRVHRCYILDLCHTRPHLLIFGFLFFYCIGLAGYWAILIRP